MAPLLFPIRPFCRHAVAGGRGVPFASFYAKLGKWRWRNGTDEGWRVQVLG